jgi:hypothetical protein
MSKYLRIPFGGDECERIEEELSLGEQKEAIVQAYNQKVDHSDEDEEELSQYGSVRDIRADDTLSEAERKRRIIRAKRKGLRR